MFELADFLFNSELNGISGLWARHTEGLRNNVEPLQYPHGEEPSCYVLIAEKLEWITVMVFSTVNGIC